MNSLDFAANDELIQVWEQVRDDDTINVALITGAGRQAFCAGADLKTYTMAYATTPAPEFRTKFTDGPGFAGNYGTLAITVTALSCHCVLV